MNAKEYLSQLRFRSAKIDALLERRAKYRDLALRCTTLYRGSPGGTLRVSSVEEYVCRIVDLEQEIDQRLSAYVRLTREIERAIDAVPDPRYRELLRFRYVNGWSLSRIAREMHMSEDWVKHLHGEALQQFDVPA